MNEEKPSGGELKPGEKTLREALTRERDERRKWTRPLAREIQAKLKAEREQKAAARSGSKQRGGSSFWPWVSLPWAGAAVALLVGLLVLSSMVSPDSYRVAERHELATLRGPETNLPTPKIDQMLASPPLVQADFKQGTIRLEFGDGTALSGTMKAEPKLNVLDEDRKYFYVFSRLEGKTKAAQVVTAEGQFIVRTDRAVEQPSRKRIIYSEIKASLKVWPAGMTNKPEEEKPFSGQFKR